MATEPPGDDVDRARMRKALLDLAPGRGRLDRAVSAVVRAGFACVGWRVRAEGLALLPRDAAGRVAPCVLAVAPHRGWIDPFLLLLAWPRDAPRLVWFGDERAMVRSWWRRRLLPRLGMIPIPPAATPAAFREHLADARTLLGRGCCLVVFPEKGPPSARGRMRTIAAGAAWLAAAGDVPLVPVAIGGYLDAGLATRFRLRVLAPLAAPAAVLVPVEEPVPASAPDGRAGKRAARATTAALAASLAPAVADLEAWSARINRRRPLPGLRDLFH